jgi:hypothetical protein
MGKEVQRRGLWTTVKGFDADTKILARSLRKLHKNVEVAVLVEHARVQKLELKSMGPDCLRFSSRSHS